MNETEAKAALDRFLADNDELEQLSARLATFNIFRALKVDKVEIRHSNTLAWLLDPAESHGLGDVFLRRILSNMLLESDADSEGLSAAQAELMDFSDIEVRREWKHIDLMVIDRNNNLLVLIENKVGGGEMPGQLARYRQTVEHEFPLFKLVLVFLTLDGESPEDEEANDYIAYSHAKLLGVLERIIAQRSEQMPEAVVTFLAHYTNTLRRLTMQDTTLVELCQRIYRKHKEAVKLIVEYGEVSSFSQLVNEIVGHDGDCEILYTAPRNLTFVPTSWATVVPANSTVWTHLTRQVSVVCWMDLYHDKISIVFEVSRMNDPALRMACVEKLRDSGFKLSKKAFHVDATYSRFFRSSRSLRDSADEEEMRDTINGLFGKAKEEFPKVETVLKSVFLTKR